MRAEHCGTGRPRGPRRPRPHTRPRSGRRERSRVAPRRGTARRGEKVDVASEGERVRMHLADANRAGSEGERVMVGEVGERARLLADPEPAGWAALVGVSRASTESSEGSNDAIVRQEPSGEPAHPVEDQGFSRSAISRSRLLVVVHRWDRSSRFVPRSRRRPAPASTLWVPIIHPPSSSDTDPVLVDEAAQTVASSELGEFDLRDRHRSRIEAIRYTLVQRAVGSVGVVMLDVLAEHGLQVAVARMSGQGTRAG